MNSLENLKDINYDIHLSKIRKKWDDFYEANPDGPNMTKQKLLDFAKKVDDEFGHLFLPPIR